MRGCHHITLLFIILSSSILFQHSSAAFFKLPSFAITEKQVEQAKKLNERIDDVSDILEMIIEKQQGSDQVKKLPPEVIAKVQKAYGLNATGKIDNATVSLFNSSRCGVPDSTVTTWPWPKGKNNFTYAFYQGQKVKAPLKALFSRAFNRWENVTGLSFNETESFDESDIWIVFLNLNKTDVVAVSGFVRETKWAMFFDLNEKWVLPSGRVDDGEVDFETAVMHQIGHIVGLGHITNDKSAVMFPFMGDERRKVDFEANETLRIQQVLHTTSNVASTSTGGSTSTGNSTSTGGSGGSVGPERLVLSLIMALLSLCL